MKLNESILKQIQSEFKENSTIRPEECDNEYFGIRVGKNFPNKDIYDAFIAKMKYYTMAIEFADLDGQFLGADQVFYRQKLHEFQDNFHKTLGENFDREEFVSKALDRCVDKYNSLEQRLETRRYFIPDDEIAYEMEKQLYHLNFVSIAICTTNMEPSERGI